MQSVREGCVESRETQSCSEYVVMVVNDFAYDNIIKKCVNNSSSLFQSLAVTVSNKAQSGGRPNFLTDRKRSGVNGLVCN